MDFAEEIRVLANRAEKSCGDIKTEEATKQALVVPFLKALGYDIYDPTEVVPEFTADVGKRKLDKVDYAIMGKGQPIMLVEAKWCGLKLDNEHMKQLFHYFSVTDVRVAVLTNGVVYRFFTDLEKTNQMDGKPFLEFDLLHPQEDLISELKRFSKAKFDIGEIIPAAAELKYTREIKLILAEQLRAPTDEFVRFFATQVYSGKLMAKVMLQFRGVTQRALRQFINGEIEARLKSAMDKDDPREQSQTEEILIAKPEPIPTSGYKLDRNQARRKFWTLLLERAKQKTDLHGRVSPAPSSLIGASAGKTGVYYQYRIGKNSGRVEVYIDTGIAGGDKTDKDNIRIFHDLKRLQTSIEQTFRGSLEWENKAKVRACCVFAKSQGGYRENESEWPRIMDSMIDTMIRLKKAFGPHIEKL